MLLVLPCLISLDQIDHLYRVHMSTLVSINESKNLFELHFSHVNLFTLLILIIDKRVQFLYYFKDILFVQLLILVFVILSKEFDKVCISTLLVVVNRLVDALLIR